MKHMITDIYRIDTMNSTYEIKVLVIDGKKQSVCKKMSSDQQFRPVSGGIEYLEKLCIGPSFLVPGVVATSNVQDYAHFVLSTEPKRKAKALQGSETGIPEFFQGLAEHVIEQANPKAVRMAAPVYGQCTRCGCIEVELDQQKGVQDLSFMGEDSEYPYGSPCEVCKDKPLDWRSATAPDNWAPGETYAEALKD